MPKKLHMALLKYTLALTFFGLAALTILGCSAALPVHENSERQPDPVSRTELPLLPSQIQAQNPRVLVVHDALRRTEAATGLTNPDVLIVSIEGSPASYAASLVDFIAALPDPDKLELLILAPAPAGGARALARLRQLYPELRMVALEPEEAVLEIEAAADLVISTDPVAAAYSAVQLALQQRAARLISVAYAPLPDSSVLQYRQAALSRISAALGLEHVAVQLRLDSAVSARTATGLTEAAFLDLYARRRTGPLAAGQAIRLVEADTLPEPERTAVFSADRLAGPVLQRLALRYDLFLAGGQALVAVIGDTELRQNGAEGQMAFPAVSGLAALEVVLVHSLLSSSSQTTWHLPDQSHLLKLLQQLYPESAWRVDYIVDPQTGVRSRIHLTIFQDTKLAPAFLVPTATWQVPTHFYF